MKSKAAKALEARLLDYWDDQARLLGGTDRHSLLPTWSKGEMTMPQFVAYLQKTLNALARACLGNGTPRYPVKLVTGRVRSGVNPNGDNSEWHINIGDAWAGILYLYSWRWAMDDRGSHRDGKFEMHWMRMFRRATDAFFARAMYLSEVKPPPPKPSKDQVRARKIERFEARREVWLAKQARARKWIIKIDRSLRGLRRHQ